MNIEIFKYISQEYLNLTSGVSLNSNFLETNVINILLLLFGLIYVLRQFLGSILLERQEKVILAIKESEERLEQANIRLNEAQKQLEQTQIIISQIIQESEVTATRVRESILEQGKIDVEKLTTSSKASILSAEYQIKNQIQQQIIALAINKVELQLKAKMTTSLQNKLIDQNIIQLKGHINI